MAQYCQTEFGDLKKAERDVIDARRQKLDVLRNTAKRTTIMNDIAKNGGIKNAAETIRSLLHGSNKLGRLSIESSWHGLSNQWQAVLDNDLFKKGLKEIAYSGNLDKDVSVAWWNLSMGKDAGQGPAADIARSYMKTLDYMRDRINESGGRIGDAKGYVTTTRHDPVKMRAAAGPGKTADEAFKAWWDFSQPKMSERMFQGATEGKEAIARQIYDSLVTGVHMTAGGPAESGYMPKDYQGTVNVNKQVSEHRTILWKDGESWNNYMKEFGADPTLHSSVMMSLDRGARAMSLMDKLGTNPAANLNMIIRKIQETYRGQIDDVKDFQNKIQDLQNVMGRLDGSLNIPANMGMASAGAAARSFEGMTMLGGVGITHFASIFPTVTSELAHHGINRLESIGNMMRALVTGAGDAGRREIMADLGAYSDGIMRHMQNLGGDDSIPGRISNIMGRFMDMTGLHFLFDRTKAGVRDMLAHNLGRNLDKDWKDLDPHLANMLDKYRITPDEWGMMQKVDNLPSDNGRTYLTPSAAKRVDGQTVEDTLRENGVITPETSQEDVYKAVDKFRNDLSDKLLSYYSDGAAHAVVTPGVRERALLLGSTRPGTGAGELMRFIMQFKMWPVAAMHQILEREIFMSLSGKEAAWNIGKLVAIGVPAGYLRMFINDEITGHPARDPTDPRTLLAAAAQSGGLGIMGDFLFGEASRMGASPIATAGGPVISDVDSLWKIFNGWKEGKAGWGDLAHFAVRHIPFANLVYLKGALDYLLWYHLYEAANPGWWERSNRRLLKEQGRTMTGYTPGAGVPWGVPGAYLSAGGNTTGILAGKQENNP
jgi:hypothetical protein